MNWRRVTKWLLVVTAVVWAVYDLFPFADPARGDTISEVLAEYSLRLFSIPFLFGMLCGHFFWLRDDAPKPKPYFLVPIWLGVAGLDVVAYVWKVQALAHLQTFPIVWFLIGIPTGVLFWGQTKSDKLSGDL